MSERKGSGSSPSQLPPSVADTVYPASSCLAGYSTSFSSHLRSICYLTNQRLRTEFLLNGQISTSLHFQRVSIVTMHFVRLLLLTSATKCLAARASWTKRNDSCTPLSLGKGPKPVYDTPQSFLNSKEMISISNKAQTPPHWARSFQGRHASSTGDNYLGYVTMDSYDTETCAAYCTKIDECQSINIFFERAPSVKLGNDCRNPPSTTLIKCTLWSTFVTEAKAKNEGSTDRLFERLIAGSNAYFNTRAIDPTTGLYPSPGPGQTFEYCEFAHCYNSDGPPKKYRHS
ncbi:hypothetical protein P171DRAFT_174716 [Karstenula rhodostoma CBS 690.94]|uniref:Apple domain-containing protein n=1 Tax=Karstenula rhodostoma CBS 690.94 TaxID=1392251 RepID=A0A9P4P614_9PLEO|nr:hypothetical protein P171DRAFT_174716 [Karstenula rhodostoma CBS 690.94]